MRVTSAVIVNTLIQALAGSSAIVPENLGSHRSFPSIDVGGNRTRQKRDTHRVLKAQVQRCRDAPSLARIRQRRRGLSELRHVSLSHIARKSLSTNIFESFHISGILFALLFHTQSGAATFGLRVPVTEWECDVRHS